MRHAALLVLLALASCTKEPPKPAAKRAAPPCAADLAGEWKAGLPVTEGCDGRSLVCRVACEKGDVSACLGFAVALESDPGTAEQADTWFQRACELGAAIGCTNHAAKLWASKDAEANLACARRTFVRACDAGEPFGCGMAGRLILDGATSREDVQQGKAFLEASCERLSGFPCRVLAMKLEAGFLGGYEPGRIEALLRRACEGGDPDACAAKKAGDTFQPVTR